MTVPTKPLDKVTQEAVRVLVRELGVAQTLRFLGQYRTGAGNYTEDRRHVLDDSPLDTLIGQARRIDEERDADA